MIGWRQAVDSLTNFGKPDVVTDARACGAHGSRVDSTVLRPVFDQGGAQVVVTPIAYSRTSGFPSG